MNRLAIFALLITATAARADDQNASTSTPPPPNAVGEYASFGFGFAPSGVDGPGTTTAEILQLGVGVRFRREELRAGALLALEQTSYQGSTSGLLIVQELTHLGERFAFGGGIGLGGGSFGTKGDANGDNGGTFELALEATPVKLQLGRRNRLELGLDFGALVLAKFGNEVDPYFYLSVGYSRW